MNKLQHYFEINVFTNIQFKYKVLLVNYNISIKITIDCKKVKYK